MFPYSSPRAVQPLGTQVVAVASAITAGPRTAATFGTRSRRGFGCSAVTRTTAFTIWTGSRRVNP